MEINIVEARTYALAGLRVSGAHNKQWYLERILIALGVDLNTLKSELPENERNWPKGIAP